MSRSRYKSGHTFDRLKVMRMVLWLAIGRLIGLGAIHLWSQPPSSFRSLRPLVTLGFSLLRSTDDKFSNYITNWFALESISAFRWIVLLTPAAAALSVVNLWRSLRAF